MPSHPNPARDISLRRRHYDKLRDLRVQFRKEVSHIGLELRLSN
jgi:hypothetical protein